MMSAPHEPTVTPSKNPGPVDGRIRRVVLWTIGATAAVLITVGIWLVTGDATRTTAHTGSREPSDTASSPAQYARKALDFLSGGYYAIGPDWEEARADVERAAQNATAVDQLHAPLTAATTVAGGKHSSFFTPEQAKEQASRASQRFTLPQVRTDGDITTVVIPAVSDVSTPRQEEYARTAAQGIADAAATTCGWVVDLRGNTGGTMYPMLSGISPLLSDGPVMSFVTREGEKSVVTAQDDGAGFAGETQIAIPVVPKVADRPIAVLQDERTASSGEIVLAAFRGRDRVRSFGTPSAGYTSGNAVKELPDGALIVLTGAIVVDHAGVNLGEGAIAPDTAVGGDLAYRAAKAWLVEQGCG